MAYREYWAYKRVEELGYKIRVAKTKVTILFPDGDVYGEFNLKKDDGNEYLIYLDGELINDELEFYGTYDEAVSSCFYYFITRF